MNWFLQRRHGVPESRLRASDASMSCHYRPRDAVIEPHFAAVRKGVRPLAAYIIQAPAFLRSFISPFSHKLSGVIVRPSFTEIMDPLPIRPDGSPYRIQRGQPPEQEIVQQRPYKIYRIGRTSGDVDCRDAQNLAYSRGVRGIGPRSLYISKGGAGSYTNR